MRRIFISATSPDLGSYRRAVRDVRLSKDVFPVLQDHFPPDYRTVVEILEDGIRRCDAMICLAGFVYGREPSHQPADAPRSSISERWRYFVPPTILNIRTHRGGCELPKPACGNGLLRSPDRGEAARGAERRWVSGGAPAVLLS